MPLVSQLFQTDPVLIACLRGDDQPIGLGACGPHVALIQFAALLCGRGIIPGYELDAQLYANGTAAAVSAFQALNALDASQHVPIGTVDRTTLARLDSAMAVRETGDRLSGSSRLG